MQRQSALEMQADAPGGHAAGAEVSLDSDDIAMQDFLRGEFENEWSDDEQINGNDELLDELNGYAMLCHVQTNR